MISATYTSITLVACFFLYAATLFLSYGLRNYKQVLKRQADDEFISSRLCQKWFTIGCSLYVGAVGTWVLTAPVGVGFEGGMSAILLYAFGCSAAWVSYLYMGPKLRNMMQYSGYTLLEFIERRYGNTMHGLVTLVNLITLLLYLSVEFITLRVCVSSISENVPPVLVMIGIALLTTAYSALGGFSATMLADRFQAIITILIILVCYGAIYGVTFNSTDNDIILKSLVWTAEGAVSGLCLAVSVIVAELINPGTWQRVYAAATEKDVIKGFSLSIVLMFLSMIVFGLAGPCAKIASEMGFITFSEKDTAENGLFLLLGTVSDWFSILVICMAFCLVATTAMYLQTAATAICAGIFSKTKMETSTVYTYARIAGILFNLPCILIAVINPPEVIQLFMIMNLLAATVCFPIMLGFTKFATQEAALIGVITGIISIFLFGFAFTGSATEALVWATFPEGYNWKCFFTIVGVFLIPGVITIIFSVLHGFWKPHVKQEQLQKLHKIRLRDEIAKQKYVENKKKKSLSNQGVDTESNCTGIQASYE